MAKPIFCVTHPRACSTAFERVFMTRKNDLTCIHEPFGDAFYFGPERLGSRYEGDRAAIQESGFAESTFKTVLDRIENEEREGKRVFIKDIIHYLFPPHGKASEIAPSLLSDPLMSKKRGIGTQDSTSAVNGVAKPLPPFPYGTGQEEGNPTVIPGHILKKFHFTFLIRDPHSSIPSYYRCTIPPLDNVTGFYEFYPSEAGYDEVRRMLDYLVASGQVGPKRAGAAETKINGHVNGNTNGYTNGHVNGTNGTNGTNGMNGTNGYTNGVNGHSEESNGHINGINGNSGAEICLIDADDLLDNPVGIMQEYCRSVGLDYDSSMLKWDSEESHAEAKEAFEKWRGFHDDAINSKDLKPRVHKKKVKTEEEWDTEWKAKYGEKGAKLIRETVDANMDDYLYLKQFAMKVY